MTLLSVCRLTPRASAPSVTDKPKASRHALRTIRPGCAGFFIGMPLSSCFALVVVDQFNVKRIGTFEPKNNTPVCPHGYRPETLPVAFQRMKAITREIQLLRSHGVIKNRQNFLNCIYKIWPYSSPVGFVVKPFKAPMLTTPDHCAYAV